MGQLAAIRLRKQHRNRCRIGIGRIGRERLMATLSLLIFLLGAGAYALTRRFGRSVAAATAAGVAAMFLIEYSTKGTVSGTGRAIVALTILSAGISLLGVSYAILLAMAVVVLREDDTGYAFAFYLMTFLPLTILTAWLGERIGRRRGARAT